MLSKTCEYALRAMIYVAQQSRNGHMVNIREISEQINSPQLFAAKILQTLNKKGFVHSAKGRYGGFCISNEQADFSLADIVEAIDGRKMFHGCGLGLEFCSETNPCPIHNQYKEAREKLYAIYGEVTLASFRDGNIAIPLQLKRA